MDDVTDGLMLDVRKISATDLEFVDPGSALSRALERILLAKPESNFSGFNNYMN